MRVYPRTCGGTGVQLPEPAPRRGLSPHVRGNRLSPLDRLETPGSIPARAGEPTGAPFRSVMIQVYPRTCGGTETIEPPLGNWTGLSPHVRGNRSRTVPPGTGARSIPARAGEPCCSSPPARRPGVYPRTCGGTGLPADRINGPSGLSPHVRGNLPGYRYRLLEDGSIPARAGEPNARQPWRAP